jgi:hypothetical protein
MAPRPLVSRGGSRVFLTTAVTGKRFNASAAKDEMATLDAENGSKGSNSTDGEPTD